MASRTIGLVAAMPNEIRPFLKQVRKHDKTTLHGFPLYQFAVSENHCSLIESGIGSGRAERATGALIKSIHPDLLISIGFGGAVKPGLSPGDLAIAVRSILYRENAFYSGETIELPDSSKARRIVGTICEKFGCKVMQSDFITSDVILNKKVLRDILPVDISNPVLDMETWAVARMAGQGEIPFLAIRAISDAAEEELEFSLDQFTDSEMNIRIGRILCAIARTPRILPQLLRLAKNARIAGRNLAIALDSLLNSEALSKTPSDLLTG
jgi:adenosylhomocysteine nucleosidase